MSPSDAPAEHPAAGEEEEWSYATRLEQPPVSELPATPPDQPGDVQPAVADRPLSRQEEAEGHAAPEDDRPPGDTQGRDGGNDSSKREGEDRKDEPPPPPPSKWVFILVGLLLAGLLAWGGYAHWRRNSDAGATQQAEGDKVPELRTAVAGREDKPIDLTLPGQTEALDTANLYARATGYVSERRVDIGSRVKKGDLLLHIAAPDLDQQLLQAEAQVGQVKAAEAQAEAQVAQAEANVNLAKVTLARTATLTNQGYETLQNRDNQTATLAAQQANLATAQAGVKVAEANTKAQLATVERLRALAGFEDVVAPFDGVVTVRNVDVGDLINADTASATPMFSLARDDVIRVTLQVPQNAAVGVRDGLPAKVEVSQMPGQIFRGTVARSSVALLSSARTLDTEVDIPNPDGRIRPGLFAYVSIDIPRDHPYVTVPAEALIFDQHGLRVATVDGDKAALHSVKVYRDLGTTVELSEGLEGGEQVILSPPALLQGGTKIKVKPADQKDAGGNQGDQKQTGDKGGQKDGGDKSEQK